MYCPLSTRRIECQQTPYSFKAQGASFFGRMVGLGDMAWLLPDQGLRTQRSCRGIAMQKARPINTAALQLQA